MTWCMLNLHSDGRVVAGQQRLVGHEAFVDKAGVAGAAGAAADTAAAPHTRAD